MEAPPFQILTVSWDTHREPLSTIRFEVFVQEQQVPPEVELDDWDPVCVHILALDAQEQPVGCGRLLPDGHIGRMAVRKAWRGQGIGRLLLNALVEAARNNSIPTALLSAQLHALPFYEKAGFEAYGPIYDDVGIPHRDMKLDLSNI